MIFYISIDRVDLLVTKITTRTLAIRGYVRLRATFVNGFVSSRTFTGLPQDWTCIIYAGGYLSYRNHVQKTEILRRETHACSALCSAPGICQIDTAPTSIEAVFSGRHETFHYTKVIIALAYMAHILFIFSVFPPSIHKVWCNLIYWVALM